MMGNLNGWVVDRVREYITSKFGVPGKNGRSMAEVFTERGAGNECFKNKYICTTLLWWLDVETERKVNLS